MSTLSPPSNLVSISKLRQNLSQLRRQVQAGAVVPVEYYRDRVGYLVPVAIADGLNPLSSQEMGLIEFRDDINQAWEAIDQGSVDCIWLTYHGERKLAFVSERLYQPTEPSQQTEETEASN